MFFVFPKVERQTKDQHPDQRKSVGSKLSPHHSRHRDWLHQSEPLEAGKAINEERQGQNGTRRIFLRAGTVEKHHCGIGSNR